MSNSFVSYRQTKRPESLYNNFNDFIEIEETPSLDDLSDYIYPELEEITIKQSENIKPKDNTKSKYFSNSKKYNTNISFKEMLDLIGANATITSGYRPGAKTKQGRLSYHAVEGGAYDIIPNDKDFNRLKLVLTTHPLSIAWFRDHDKGILDETSKEMLAKTGGTGAHFHIGPDLKAERFWKTVMAKSGIKIKKENKGKFTDYCGGKVTNECILKGKNSSSSTIRKRATFAANVRKWHKK